MANPFSGLENIGQSYLQGVQLAQQRQLREEAIAQRQEEARIRERYYQDLVQQRADAAQLAAQGRTDVLEERRQARLDQAAATFGKYLVLNQRGEPDYAASSKARDIGLEQQQVAAAEGEMAGTLGTNPPLAAEIIRSPAYRAGQIKGTAARLARENMMMRDLVRRGFVPRELPAEVESQVGGFVAPDIFQGQPPMAAPAPSAPRLRMAGREFIPPAPRTEKAPSLGYETIDLPGGGKARINLTPERAAQIQAQAAKLASGESPGDPFADIDAAEQKLRDLRVRNIKDFTLVRKPDGTVDVAEDSIWSIARSPAEIKADLELERKKRREIIKESEMVPGPEAAIGEGTNRVQPSQFGSLLMETERPGGIGRVTQPTNRVIRLSDIPGLPPLRGR